MGTARDIRQEHTIAFLPHRLNRQPVIVRGMTADELWISVGLSASCGLILGTILAVLTHSFPMAPTTVIVCVALGVFVGGGFLRRHKRGRPDTWLVRQLQWWVRRRCTTLAGYVGAADLITRSGYWSTHRGQRP